MILQIGSERPRVVQHDAELVIGKPDRHEIAGLGVAQNREKLVPAPKIRQPLRRDRAPANLAKPGVHDGRDVYHQALEFLASLIRNCSTAPRHADMAGRTWKR